MKAAQVLSGIGLWLLTLSAQAQPGLKGEYYTGTNFGRKVFTRIDPQLNFNWAEGSPGAGMPHSYYSIRWTGKLLAPATGNYQFFAKVDDGIRIWVGNRKVMDSWQLNDSQNFTGSVMLEKDRLYDLRVDYFNDMLEGEIQLFWQRPDDTQQSFNPFGTSGKPITAQYFFQKTTIIAPPKLPAKPVLKKTVATISPPKVMPKPVPLRPLPRKRIVNDSLSARASPARPPVSEPPTKISPDTTFNLRPRNIQFEQSSYVLLPESGAELDELVTVLKKHPDWVISIAGHTDNIGDPRLNLALSEFRAKVVANYLIRAGIADTRITTAGYGDTRPVSDNSTEETRSYNRRVVIIRR